MANNLAVIQAMVSAAKAATGLSARVSNRVYFGRAEDTTMPYIILYPIVPDGPRRKFGGSDFEEVVFQWSIFDKGPGVAVVESIKSDLDLVFDRGTLTYTGNTHIGCARDGGGMGPTWDGTAWQRTVDYRVWYR